MKKIAKRVITAVLAMAMVIGMMAMTAFAADDTYSVIGSINGNWDKDTDLVKQADGTYSVDITDVKAGSYEFKIRTNHAWDNGEYNLEGDASSGGANAKVDVAKDGSTVTITFDGTKAAVTVKDASAAAPAAPAAPATPAAGDSSVMVYIVAAVAALSAVVAVVAKRRSVEA